MQPPEPQTSPDLAKVGVTVVKPGTYNIDLATAPPMIQNAVRSIELSLDGLVMAEAVNQYGEKYANVSEADWTERVTDARKRLAGLAVGMLLGVTKPNAPPELETLVLCQTAGRKLDKANPAKIRRDEIKAQCKARAREKNRLARKARKAAR